MPGLFFKEIPKFMKEGCLQKLVSELDIGKVSNIIIQKNMINPDYHAIVKLNNWNYTGPNKRLIEKLHQKSNTSSPIYYTNPVFIYYNSTPRVLLSMYKLPEIDDDLLKRTQYLI